MGFIIIFPFGKGLIEKRKKGEISGEGNGTVVAVVEVVNDTPSP
jgi:hypothetical protein